MTCELPGTYLVVLGTTSVDHISQGYFPNGWYTANIKIIIVHYIHQWEGHVILSNFLYRVKVYSNEHPPWSELRMELEKHSHKCYILIVR